MQTNTILLIGILLFLPHFLSAQETKPTYEAMDIKTLIEKSKEVSLVEREKIEKLIKQKIAKAHRENRAKG